jgi:hypothetical protein
MGSTVTNVTLRSEWAPVRVSGAEAAGTTSRIATMSHSDAMPSNARAGPTNAAAAALPWQAL